MEEMRAYREVIHENIDYQYHAKEDVDELVELIIEVMMMPEDSMIRIAGVEKSSCFGEKQIYETELFAYRIRAVLSESKYNQGREY